MFVLAIVEDPLEHVVLSPRLLQTFLPSGTFGLYAPYHDARTQQTSLASTTASIDSANQHIPRQTQAVSSPGLALQYQNFRIIGLSTARSTSIITRLLRTCRS
jgi:hypothetical protein